MLSSLVITFLPRSKHLLISWLQSSSAVILEPPKIKSATVSSVSPSISHDTSIHPPKWLKWNKTKWRVSLKLFITLDMVSPISGEQCGMKVFYQRGVLAGNGLFNTAPFLGSSSGNANLSLTVRLTAVPFADTERQLYFPSPPPHYKHHFPSILHQVL